MILQLLNVLIGLTLVYVIFSTIASAFFDAAESLVKQRGKLLARGIKEILRQLAPPGQLDTDLAKLYQQPLISSLFEGPYVPGSRKLPSYIPPERFARAVLMLSEDAAGLAPDAFVALKGFAERLVGQRSLAEGETNLKALEAELVDHFNASMDRVSGWFARYARGFLLGIGLLLAVAGNVDTIQIVRTLAMDPLLADRIAETAATYVSERTATADPAATAADGSSAADLDQQVEVIRQNQALAQTLGLPLGWPEGEFARTFGPKADVNDLIKKVIGLLLTAFALSLGAASWFDLLNQLVNLRTSLKPGDKAQASPAETAAAEPAPKK